MKNRKKKQESEGKSLMCLVEKKKEKRRKKQMKTIQTALILFPSGQLIHIFIFLLFLYLIFIITYFSSVPPRSHRIFFTLAAPLCVLIINPAKLIALKAQIYLTTLYAFGLNNNSTTTRVYLFFDN